MFRHVFAISVSKLCVCNVYSQTLIQNDFSTHITTVFRTLIHTKLTLAAEYFIYYEIWNYWFINCKLQNTPLTYEMYTVTLSGRHMHSLNTIYSTPKHVGVVSVMNEWLLVSTLTSETLLVTWCTTSLTFNNCTLCPHCIHVFCIYLRTNSDLCHLEHKLIGFYNRDEKCLQRGTYWVFK